MGEAAPEKEKMEKLQVHEIRDLILETVKESESKESNLERMEKRFALLKQYYEVKKVERGMFHAVCTAAKFLE